MQIRIHIKSTSDVLANHTCQDEGVYLITVSFWLWLKSLFCGLDLTLNALTFALPKPEGSAVKESSSLSSSVNPDSPRSEKVTGEDTSDIPNKPKKNAKGKRKSKSETLPTQTEEEIFGVQWDDYTVVYPSRQASDSSKSLKEFSTYKTRTDSPIDSVIPTKVVSKPSSETETMSDTYRHADEVPVLTKPEPIDFKNPPHSARWKARNLPPRKPYTVSK